MKKHLNFSENTPFKSMNTSCINREPDPDEDLSDDDESNPPPPTPPMPPSTGN